MATLRFKVSSALKDIIGRDLITDDYIAVFELVKNAFDAYATRVDITFENNRAENGGRIIIADNGKGMSYDDVVDKWLFVAYSAKKEGTEDKDLDYRHNIYAKRAFAGTKGIGRFSCDRLGRRLYLETKKLGNGSKTEILRIDWERFERDIKDEFINIAVSHETKKKGAYDLINGTVLEITDLRSGWDRNKLLKLKDSLAKLINPNTGKGEQIFQININAQDELEDDDTEDERHRKVNGLVQNFVFETLGLKTTYIHVVISKKRKGKDNVLTTTLVDGGTLIYKTKEVNKFDLLWDIEFKIYFLNRAAKVAFARQMGLASRLYGHIFLYKNGFRIYPFGEPFEDPLKLDIRKSRKHHSYLGTGELMGRIEIFGDNSEFKETSSRGSGLIRNSTYDQLERCFLMILERLERYVVDIQQWGKISIEDINGKEGLNSSLAELVAQISGSNKILKFEAPSNLLEILEESQVDSASTLVKNLKRIAIASRDENLLKVAKAATRKLNAIMRAMEEAEAEATAAKHQLREITSENLFLRSVKSQGIEEVISFMHSIGISATTIDNYLSGIYRKLGRGIELRPQELRKAIEAVSFEIKKILSITRFSTKANFKLYAEEARLDLVDYIGEYANNILRPLRSEDVTIKVVNRLSKPLICSFKPIEISILVDNMLSNSIRARAENFEIQFLRSKQGDIQIVFSDDGVGIPDENLGRIFDFGFTTTSGSGLGLFHVHEIVKKMGWGINVERPRIGVKFILTINGK